MSDQKKKKIRVTVDLTEDQHALISKYADHYGLSVGPYIRSVTLDRVRALDSLSANRELLEKLDKLEGLDVPKA
jgi:hypothetical protein